MGSVEPLSREPARWHTAVTSWCDASSRLVYGTKNYQYSNYIPHVRQIHWNDTRNILASKFSDFFLLLSCVISLSSSLTLLISCYGLSSARSLILIRSGV